MGLVFLFIGATLVILSLLFMVTRESVDRRKFSDGELADGGDEEEIRVLMDRAEILGLDLEEYDTWDEVAQAIKEESATNRRELKHETRNART